MQKRTNTEIEEAVKATLPAFLTNPNPDIFFTGTYVTVDFETTNIDYGDPVNPDNHIILANAYTSWDKKLHKFVGNEYEMGGLLKLIEEADFMVAQNGMFELGWLRRCGADLSKIICYDTMIGRYVEAGNLRCKKDLDSLGEYYGIPLSKLNTVNILIKSGMNPEGIPLSWLNKYCGVDVLLTESVFLVQRERLRELSLLGVMYLRSLWIPVLTDIEFNGMCLDSERVDIIFRRAENEYHKVIKEFDKFTGGINPNSPKQLSEYIYGQLNFSQLTDQRGNTLTTKTGKPLTDQESIVRLKARNKTQRRFIELYSETKKLGSRLSKYLSKMQACCEENEGILYARFNPAVTRTQRLSSSGKKYKIQYQNLDRELKPVFKARYPGWEMGEADEAQLEFRAAVYLGDDQQGRRDIADGVDAHARTSSILTQAGQSTNRQDAKSHTFKPLYGGSSGTRAEQTYYAAFKERYSGVAEAQQRWIDHVLEKKYLELPTGFKFYWPDVSISRSGYVNYTTNICNYPVQHFATAEIVPIGVIFLWHRMKLTQMESFLVNTVHDSAIGEIHPDEKELFREIAVQSFTEDIYEYLDNVYGIDFDVPLDADVSFGSHWAEKPDWKEKYLGEQQ